MGFHHLTALCRAAIIALLAGLGAALMSAPAAAGHGSDARDSEQESEQQADDAPKADQAVVVPYETRPPPSHRVSLTDDRIYFLKKLEKTDDGFVLHTMEGETIEVEPSLIEEIVEFKTDRTD